MAKYRYTATDGQGKWVSGEAEGTDPGSVEARLRAGGLAVESLAEAEPEAVGARPRASRRDSAELVEQLAALARSGLPLPSGLRAAGLEVDSPALRSIFEDLANRVEAGADLGDALAASRDRLPDHLRGLILAGARSGRLADVLGEYVGTANLGAELRRKFWSVVAYPLATAGLVLALVIAICHLSVRAVDTLIGGLPDSVQAKDSGQLDFLVLMARSVADHWPAALAVAVALGAGGWILIRVGLTPARRRRLACGVPVLGPTLRFASLTEFCHLLAMLLEAETPLPDALDLAGRSVRDADMAEACDRMAHAVAEGQTLRSALRQWDAIPAGLGQLFGWSEANRDLPRSLRMAGAMFEARARSQTGFAANLLATALVLLILWWVGFALATLYLPLISLIGRLSG